MDPEILIKKFINKTASPDEVIRLLKYLEANPKEDFSNYLKEYWEEASFSTQQSKDYDQIYQKISKAIHNKNISRSTFSIKLLKWAATISILVASVYFLVLNDKKEKIDSQLTEIEIIEKINPIGQKSKIHLPDGSVVWLNAESKLFFPSKFNSIRNVELFGEAYFEVAPNKEKPFVVTSGNIKTTALGTTFNIRAYQEENRVEVALTEGKVKVLLQNAPGNIENEFIIDPGMSITYWKNEDKIEKSFFDYDNVVGWKDGILVFIGADENKVFEELGRWYGVSFDFENINANQKWNYNGTFKNESLDNILMSIGSIKGFDFEIKENVVKIKHN